MPITNDAYMGAVVNATTISAECGLLSNTSVGYWDYTLETYNVNVSGLGAVAMRIQGIYDFSCFLFLHLA